MAGSSGSWIRGLWRHIGGRSCRVVDWGPRWVEWILRRRATSRVHVAGLWGCRASFGVRRVWVYWLYRDACHWNLLTFKWALELLAPPVQVATETEEAADGGGNHSNKEDHSRGDACYGLGTEGQAVLLLPLGDEQGQVPAAVALVAGPAAEGEEFAVKPRIPGAIPVQVPQAVLAGQRQGRPQHQEGDGGQRRGPAGPRGRHGGGWARPGSGRREGTEGRGRQARAAAGPSGRPDSGSWPASSGRDRAPRPPWPRPAPAHRGRPPGPARERGAPHPAGPCPALPVPGTAVAPPV